jgi:hypothetical protein
MLNGPFETDGVSKLFQHPNGSLFAISYALEGTNGLYRSDDLGYSWEKIFSSSNWSENFRCVNGRLPGEIFLGFWDGYFYSSDNGAN